MKHEKAVIFHNPRCTKSREALTLLLKNNIQPEVIEYLKNPPSKNELKELLKLLKIKPRELIRKNESIYKENKLADLPDAKLIDAMLENPILIERPIFIYKGKAIIGRPPSLVLELT